MSPTCTVRLHLIIVDISHETHSPSIEFVCRETQQGIFTEPILEALYNTSALIRNLANILYLPKTFADKKTIVYFVFTELENALLSKLLVLFRVFSCNVYLCVPALAVKSQLNEKTT